VWHILYEFLLFFQQLIQKNILNKIKAEYDKKETPLKSINTDLRGERE
jgi:hypothetical protein